MNLQAQDGSLSIHGSTDILTLALGTPEVSGRVRGVGAGVTPSTYFHMPRHENHSHCEQKHKFLEAAMQQMQAQIFAMGQQTPYTPQSDNISSNKLKSDSRGSPQPHVILRENRSTAKDVDKWSTNKDVDDMSITKDVDNKGKTNDDMPPINPGQKTRKVYCCMFMNFLFQ